MTRGEASVELARRRPIAVYDSGIGGLPYLETARSALPLESFVYLGDRAGFPYGTKGREEVKDIVVGLIAKLVRRFRPKAVVIACNTASQAGLEAARRANPGLPIVGTVPAVKPAAERTRSGVIAVLATAGAVEDPYLDSLVARHAKAVEVVKVAAQALVTFVERRSPEAGSEERREAVAAFVRPLVERGVDEIVLACTHFLHLRDDISAVAGPGVEVVDSRGGVVRRLKQVLGERFLLEPSAPESEADRGPARPTPFLLTGDAPFEGRYAALAARFGLAEPGPLEPR